MEKHPIYRLCELSLLKESKFILFRQLVSLLLLGIFVNFILSNDNLFFGNTHLFYFHFLGILASAFFGLNIFRKVAVISILSILAYTLYFSPFSLRVIPGYLGFYLIYTLFIPDHEGKLRALNNGWRIDHFFHTVFILIIAFSFTYSGLTKLSSAQWLTGEALSIMKNNPRFDLAFDLLKNDSLLKIITKMTLFIELAFFPLYCFKKTRTLAVYTLAALFIGLFFFTKIPIVITTMLLFIFYCHESDSNPRAL